jgi:membrane protein YdbS with pleckstrin-like domain
MRLVSLLVLLWLIVGAIAAGQRGYFSSSDTNCASLGTIAVTIVAGPLNYLGVNPKVTNCELPQPSQ